MNKKILFLFMSLQLSFWYYSKQFDVNIPILPEVPTAEEVGLLSLGDPQAYFRIYGMKMQNAGDRFGVITSLQDYDYKKLKKWFVLLDELDSRSSFIASLASYYYCNTQRKEDVRYIVEYLDQHAEKDLERKWWWMVQGAMLASIKLGDNDLALKLAYKLAQFPNASYPIWAKNMPAIILLDAGDPIMAEKLALRVIEDVDNISERDLIYMSYFVKHMVAQSKKGNKNKREN